MLRKLDIDEELLSSNIHVCRNLLFDLDSFIAANVSENNKLSSKQLSSKRLNEKQFIQELQNITESIIAILQEILPDTQRDSE